MSLLFFRKTFSPQFAVFDVYLELTHSRGKTRGFAISLTGHMCKSLPIFFPFFPPSFFFLFHFPFSCSPPFPLCFIFSCVSFPNLIVWSFKCFSFCFSFCLSIWSQQCNFPTSSRNGSFHPTHPSQTTNINKAWTWLEATNALPQIFYVFSCLWCQQCFSQNQYITTCCTWFSLSVLPSWFGSSLFHENCSW